MDTEKKIPIRDRPGVQEYMVRRLAERHAAGELGYIERIVHGVTELPKGESLFGNDPSLPLYRDTSYDPSP